MFVTTTNDGSGQSEDKTCVKAADIKILKKADKSPVDAGDDIGFTVTVWNAGAGDAYGTALNDPLPQNAGLSWSIDAQGAGWNNTCSINPAGTTLSCGPVTVPANTTQIASTFTVHITSHTTKDTAGTCVGISGIVDNTGFVTTTNDGSGNSEDKTCVKAADIKILKTADHASVNAGEDVGFTVTVWNAGVGDAKGVTLNDPLPQNAGLLWSIDAQGAGWTNTCSINPAGTTLAAGCAVIGVARRSAS